MKLSFKIATCTFITALGLMVSTNAFAAELLKIGSRGSEVSTLQQALKSKGYFTHDVTGYYGSITKNAVIRFQGANRLAQDGIAGPNTFNKLYSTANNTLFKIGSSGDGVRKLQQALKDKGYFNHGVTGYYGSITRASVINFQRANGLASDGIAGPNTLNSLYGSGKSSAPVDNSANYSYTEQDLYWLSRIIEAEAKGESYTGKVAVGNVVLNRVKSPLFPSTVKGVIFEYYKGIPMFSPVENGTIYNNPTQESINAAKAALNGERPVANATYFFNPSISKGTWIVNNKTYLRKIGGHAFYV